MRFQTVAVAVAAFAAGGVLTSLLVPSGGRLTPAALAQQAAAQPDLTALAAEVERLKKVVPDQAHAMKDVDYHFTNLWFAGEAENWPLADFYWKETLSHIKWAVRIIPVRKDNAGKEVKLEEILQSIEQSPFMQMGDAVKKQDKEHFEKTYRYLMVGCYACHKASDKPYLVPQLPKQPATAMINFDPKAPVPETLLPRVPGGPSK